LASKQFESEWMLLNETLSVSVQQIKITWHVSNLHMYNTEYLNICKILYYARWLYSYLYLHLISTGNSNLFYGLFYSLALDLCSLEIMQKSVLFYSTKATLLIILVNCNFCNVCSVVILAKRTQKTHCI
jgi:hypothetical protein